MANGISKNPLTDISKVYLNQIAEGSLKSLEKASVLAMSDDPKDQDKARDALIDLIADDIFNDLMDRPGPHG